MKKVEGQLRVLGTVVGVRRHIKERGEGRKAQCAAATTERLLLTPYG